MFSFQTASELIIVHTILFLMAWAIHYYFMKTNSNKHYNRYDSVESHLIDSMYYTTICQSTLGFGDIVPVSPITKIVTSIHVLVTIILTASILLASSNEGAHMLKFTV